MRRRGRGRRLLSGCVLAAGLLGGTGCLQFLHPVHAPPEAVEPCRELPSCSRRHVYIFLANGVDPLCLGNLAGVREYLDALGFTQTYYGQVYHAGWLKRHLRAIHKDDHDARFVLIGYGHGADAVRAVARSVARDGIPIDLLLTMRAGVAHALAPDQDATSTDGASPLPQEHCLGSPTDPGTLRLLAAELAAVAARVPVAAPLLPPPPAPHALPETAPQPRPVNPNAVSAEDEED